MIFPYRSIISSGPNGDFYLLRRPEIPISIVGSTRSGSYIALVDSGSDQTIIPKSIATYLGIDEVSEAGPKASVFGGQRVELMTAQATFKLEEAGQVLEWKESVAVFDFPVKEDETVILGHAGFLDYFTATFDGKQGLLTLNPNDELPLIK
jgi:hypothetical protein